MKNMNSFLILIFENMEIDDKLNIKFSVQKNAFPWYYFQILQAKMKQQLALACRLVKFGLSEKHTKFEKICLMVLTNQLIYLVNVKTIRQIFSNYVCFSKSPNFTK